MFLLVQSITLVVSMFRSFFFLFFFFFVYLSSFFYLPLDRIHMKLNATTSSISLNYLIVFFPFLFVPYRLCVCV